MTLQRVTVVTSVLIALLALAASCSHAQSAADSKEIDPAALEARYRAEGARRRARIEQTVYDRVTRRQGILSQGTDYFQTGPAYEKIQQQKRAAMAKINALRAAGKTGTTEYWKAQEEFYQVQAIDYRDLSNRIDRRFNDYDSTWFGTYTIHEWMGGCWNDAKTVTLEVWAKKWDLLKTVIDKGPAEAIKSLFFETFDATYKVRFVEVARNEHGATQRIAEFWWDHFVMSNFKKSNLMEIIEEVAGKGTEKLQEKLEEKVKERLTEELKKKLAETGEKMTSDAVKKTAESAAKNWIKNLVTAPAILIEFTARYWNVASFEQMFLRAAPGEALYLKEIKRVLTALKKLNDDEVNRCYFDRNYFLALRKKVGLPRPKIPEPKPEPAKKKGVKIRVKRHLQPEIDTVWAFLEEKEKITERVKTFQKDPPKDLDNRPFFALVDRADVDLRTDAMDLASFGAEIQNVRALYDSAWQAWQAGVLKAADIRDRANEERRTIRKRDEFRGYVARVNERVQKDLQAHLARIQAVARIRMADRLENTRKAIQAKVDALFAGLGARSPMLVRTGLLTTTRPDYLYDNHYEQFGQFWDALGRCGMYKAITRPESNMNGVPSGLVVILMGEWFSKSVYDIWHTGTMEHLAMLNDIAKQEQALNAWLDPPRGLWRVRRADGTWLPEVEKIVGSFQKAADRKSVTSGYHAFSGREDWVHSLLRKREIAEKQGTAALLAQEARVEGLAAELGDLKKWLNTEGKALEDKGLDDWKAVCRGGLVALAAFTAGDTDLGKLDAAQRSLTDRQRRYLARRSYLDDMGKLASSIQNDLERQSRNLAFRIEDAYRAYLAKYEVPERAIFPRVASARDAMAPALAMKVTLVGLEKRVADYNCQPDGLYDGIQWSRDKMPIRFDFRWMGQKQREVAQGYVKGLGTFADLYRKGLKASVETNDELRATLVAFEKKLDRALDRAVSQEEYSALDTEWWAIDRNTSTAFWKRTGSRTGMPFGKLKLDAGNLALYERIGEKRTKFCRKMQEEVARNAR